MKVHGIELSKKEEGVVRYFFDLTCHYLAVMQKSGSYYLFDFQAGGERRVGAGDIRFHRNPCYLEVTAADLPYLKKPEGLYAEYGEFRKVAIGDSMLCAKRSDLFTAYSHSAPASNVTNINPLKRIISGYRWCKPREVDAFEVWWESKGRLLIGASHKRLAENGWEAALASK